MKHFFLISLCFCFNRAAAQWTEICSTGNGFVTNFETFDGGLFATGFFTTLCGTSCNYVAKWDGTSWTAAGNGFSEAGHQLRAINNELYGVRYEPDIDSNWVYRFDGSNFTQVGEGVYLTTAVTGFSQTANLYSILSYNGELVACGEFDRVGNRNISGIMRYNGTLWDSLGAGLSGNIPGTSPIMYPHELCLFGTDLIVAGNFRSAGGQIVNGIARWDGTQWHAMGQGFNSTVYGICVYNGELYAGGDFTMSGTNPVEYIAKWDGTQWISPGFSLSYENAGNYSFIHTLKEVNGRLLIAGGFDKADTGLETFNCTAIVAFDGTSLDTLAGGLPNKEVEAIAFYNGQLIAGGGLNSSSYIAAYQSTAGTTEQTVPAVTISPNPANPGSAFRIESGQLIEDVKITAISGQEILHLNPGQNSTDIVLSRAGAYFVTVSSGGEIQIHKIIASGE